MSAAQLELFPQNAGKSLRLIVLDIDDLDQSKLISVFVRMRTRVLIDMRLRPVFDSPKFRHSELLYYMYERRIDYIQFNLEKNRVNRNEYTLFDLLNKRRLAYKSYYGSMVVIRDSGADAMLQVHQLRTILRRFGVSYIDILPNSL